MARKKKISTMPPEASLEFASAKPKQVVMQQSVVCWLDLLGLRDRLALAGAEDREPAFVAEYLRILRPIYRSLQWSFEDSNFNWNAFTDTIVLSVRVDRLHPEPIVGFTAMASSEIQFRLACAGWFLRGAISYGSLWRSKQFVIGTGLLNSYKLETEEAVWPRVILDKTIRDVLPTFMDYYAEPADSPQNQEFARDEDGHVFLNYLFTPFGQDYPLVEIKRLLRVHMTRVSEQLVSFSTIGRLRSKYLWVAAYHNWFCVEWLGKQDSRGLIIDDIPRRGFAKLTV